MILQVMEATLSLWAKHGVVRVIGVEMLSESKSVSERDDSDYELTPSLAKKRCSTPTGQSATSFPFNS